MSHAVTNAHRESSGTWLPLTEYSVRSGISPSTIRRKIKTNSIPYRLERGRYLILFREGEPKAELSTPPSYVQELRPVVSEAHLSPTPAMLPKVTATERDWGSPDFDRAVHMISEAFEHILHEKDERIRVLERINQDLDERLLELKTLVRVLEEKYGVRY